MTTLLEPPAPSEGSEAFWAATRERRLDLPWCTACGRALWFPREVCPACLGSAIEWRPAAGTGVVHAVSVHHKPGPGRDPADGPYAVALVDLPEGVRLMANVVGCPPGDVTVGTPVQVAWQALGDGRNLPQFTPAAPA
ncbi:MAG TPA: OB-fold domain-containing protein [Acidimicrobiales bacterium]|nr:OB-fold domain-containing protein [Acidimicrobiales bacterium]